MDSITASSTAAAPSRRWLLCGAALILVGAGAVRLAAGLDGLWLDEIWSLGLASRASSPWDILTGLHHENNHYLNTFWIWLVGPHAHWLLYRLPAMFAGVVATGFAGSIGMRRGPLAAVLTMLLAATSYLLIHYSSEARGYSYAVCSALACVDFQERMLRGAGWRSVVGTLLSALAGILSQPVFLAFYGALLLWSGGKVWLGGRSTRPLRKKWCLAHAPALLFFVFLYEVDLWQLINGGGPIYPLGEVVAQTLSLAIGGPDTGAGITAGASCACLLYLAALSTLWHRDRDWCILSVLTVIVMPTVLMIVTGRREVYPRYFLIPVAFFQLTLGLAVAGFDARGRQGRILAGILLGCIVLGNCLHTFRLLNLGRGGYFPLMADLAELSPGDQISVGSDHDFRNPMVLAFYAQYLPTTKRLVYLSREQRPAAGPDWLLMHFLDREAQAKPEVSDSSGNRYHLERFYPYAGLSGWSWALYRNDSGRGQNHPVKR